MTQKRIFNQTNEDVQATSIPTKQEFHVTEVQVDTEPYQTDPEFNSQFEEIVQPKPRWWKKILFTTIILFLFAAIAQSIQWVIDTYQQQQWIYLLFAVVCLLIIGLGINAIVQEWRTLVKLKRHSQLQQQSQQMLLESAVISTKDFPAQNAEKGITLCQQIVKNMQLTHKDSNLVKWQEQISEAHSSQEITYLFSQTVLHPIDQQVKKLVSKNAAEACVIVAISPLAIVDMLFIAWRNLSLVNKIAKLYGIELGYISRIRLIRMILINIAFAGATELVQEVGIDWLSQDLTAKLSARAAQGIGVGLLTARLGIKAMEYCRPLAFQKNEKPKLSIIHKELLTTLKSTLFTHTKVKEMDRV